MSRVTEVSVGSLIQYIHTRVCELWSPKGQSCQEASSLFSVEVQLTLAHGVYLYPNPGHMPLGLLCLQGPGWVSTSPPFAPRLPDTSFLLGGSLKLLVKTFCFWMALHSNILEWTPLVIKFLTKENCLSIKEAFAIIYRQPVPWTPYLYQRRIQINLLHDKLSFLLPRVQELRKSSVNGNSYFLILFLPFLKKEFIITAFCSVCPESSDLDEVLNPMLQYSVIRSDTLKSNWDNRRKCLYQCLAWSECSVHINFSLS